MAFFPRTWRIRVGCLILAALFLPWAGALPALSASTAEPLRFALAAFDPLRDPLPPGAALVDLRAPGPFLIQFAYPLSGAEAPAVERAGGEVVAYVAYGGFIVVGAPGLARALREVPGARWVGLLPSDLRMRPDAGSAPLLTVEYAGGADVLAREVASVRASLVMVGDRVATVAPGPGGARALAALPHVLWVEPYALPSPENYHAVITDGIREPTNASSYSSASGALWTFNADTADPRFLGYTGSGITVDVTDTGVDRNHPGFDGRLGAAKSWSGAPVDLDSTGHGTHVAGTAVGDGNYSSSPFDVGLPRGLYAGAAPGATLVTQTYDALYMNYTGMADFAASSGATVSVDAWGDQSPSALGCYTAVSGEYDSRTFDGSPTTPGQQPLLFVFAAGNVEAMPQSITPPGTAKNVLTVGATGNDYALPSDRVYRYSSFGPTDEGRIKPDLVAPGEMVASANSSGRGPIAGPLPPFGGVSYAYLSGTSQAAPQVAGAAAVAAQYLRDARSTLATPALLKALLINGARPLPGYSWPGPEQGWGRLDLAASLLNSSAHRVDFIPEGFWPFYSSLPSDVVQFDVTVDAGQDLRVTLAWSDPAGSAAAPSLQNDLDLEVRDENDTVIFEGNRINSSSGYSTAGASAHFDSTNNVEVVRVPSASAGTWKVFVRSYSYTNASKGPQMFALAYSGALRHIEGDLAVASVATTAPVGEIESGEAVTLQGEVVNLGGATATAVEVSALNADDALAPPYATESFLALSPSERANFTLAFFPPDGANSVTVRASSGSPEADPSNDFATVAFFVVRRQPQLTGATDVTALPGRGAVFALTATNRGNVPDLLQVGENPGMRDPNWTLSFSEENFSLSPGQSASFSAVVGVPPSAVEGDSTGAEIRLVSAANQSRTDFLSLTARAGSVHVVQLTSLQPALSVAANSLEEVPVRIVNAGNSPEDVLVTITPLWPDSAEWNGSSASRTLALGESADLLLNLTNSDSTAAGYRGLLRVRAVVASTGQLIDALVPVFVEARSCLSLGGPAEVSTFSTESASFDAVLTNCGNVALSGALHPTPGGGQFVSTPASFAAGPFQVQSVRVVVGGLEDALDGIYSASLRADASQGLTALMTVIVKHDSGVRLEAAGALSFAVPPGLAAVEVDFRNVGAAGSLALPSIEGVPSGWDVTMLRPSGPIHVAHDGEFKLTLAVDTRNESSARNGSLTLAFFPRSDRASEFQPQVNLTVASSAVPVGETQPLWPTNPGPLMAVGAGALAAVLAALYLAPSRGVLGACPACGRKAPRFDTFMNPSCSDCGESLARAARPSGDPK
jgi:subtilisin family serine protease